MKLTNAPTAPVVPAPEPVIDSGSEVLSEMPLRSSVPPLATTVPASIVPKGELVPLPAAPSRKTPALTVVTPV